MDKEILLTLIRQEFKDVTLGDAYTLVEEDYYDTSHCHFDESWISYPTSQEEWDKKEINEMTKHSWWLPEEIEEAIQAIKEKRRIFNRFPNPLNIPPLYLNSYYSGFCFLKAQGYLFYTPSIMINALCEPKEFDSMGTTSWLYTLGSTDDWVRSKLKKFNETQINTVIQFLIYSEKLDTIDEFNKEDIKKALNKVQSFKSE